MPISDGFRKSNSFVRRAWDRTKAAMRQRGEIARLDRIDAEAIARELNMQLSEFETLAPMPADSAEALGQRLSHAGLSQHVRDGQHGDVLRDLERVCSQCPAKARCTKDLKREQWAALPAYCPNEPTLQALSAEAGQKPSADVLTFPRN